jgi:hypothetical protein
MEPDGRLARSQEAATGHYPSENKLNPHPPIQSLKFIIYNTG